MTPENFVFWLQGYFELEIKAGSPSGLTANQVQIIKDHIALVLKKETPLRDIKWEDGSKAFYNFGQQASC